MIRGDPRNVKAAGPPLTRRCFASERPERIGDIDPSNQFLYCD